MIRPRSAKQSETVKKQETGSFPPSLSPQLTFSQGEELAHLLAGHPHLVELAFQPQQPDELHVAVVIIAIDGQLRAKLQS